MAEVQQIRNTDNAFVIPLRGKVSSFDVLDPQVRSQWAARIRGSDIAIFDCLRPILDALGLSEDKDAGRLLGAIGELLDEAGVPEALVVHHMGHSGERSRGDSRIIDWPDATWKLVRENPEKEDSPRYFSAYGRKVNQPESKLLFDPDSHRLTLHGGNRKDAANDRLVPAILDIVRGDTNGMSGRSVVSAMVERGHGRNEATQSLAYAVKKNLVLTSPGEKRAILHRINPNPPVSVPVSRSVPAVSRNTESECPSVPIGTGTQTHTQKTASAPPEPEHTTLFPDSNICADCGEPYNRPGLISRCKDRHQERPTP